MNRKIAFFDIDGTLINVPNGLISPTKNTIKALNEFKQQGNLIFIATARGFVPECLMDIEFDGYIYNDGHYLLYHDQVWLDDLFTQEEIKNQINIYTKYNGLYMFSGHKFTWNRFFDEPLVQKHSLMFAGTTKRPSHLVEDFTIDDIDAIACCVLFQNIEDLYNAYDELKDNYTIVLYETGLIRMDIYRKGFTKGTACQYVYDKLEIPKENSYAFGDGINDVQMLQLAGHGIAMGNAIPELKEIADDITLSVDDDGIYAAFKKYFDIII